MKLLEDLLIEDIFTKICHPNKVLMLRRISKKFKDAIDKMNIEIHLKIYGFNIDNIYNNLKIMHEYKNYIITKIEFIRYNMFMFIDLDKISILCPSLTHLDLGPYEFNFFSLDKFPNCKIIGIFKI